MRLGPRCFCVIKQHDQYKRISLRDTWDVGSPRHHMLIDADLLVLRLSALVVRLRSVTVHGFERRKSVWSCSKFAGQKLSFGPLCRGACLQSTNCNLHQHVTECHTITVYRICMHLHYQWVEGLESTCSMLLHEASRFELWSWLQPGDPLARQLNMRAARTFAIRLIVAHIFPRRLLCAREQDNVCEDSRAL